MTKAETIHSQSSPENFEFLCLRTAKEERKTRKSIFQAPAGVRQKYDIAYTLVCFLRPPRKGGLVRAYFYEINSFFS